RIPDYKFINQLLLETGRPLTGTSANISGIPGSTKIKEVVSQFQGRKNQPDLIINAGNLKKSQTSTVVDLTVLPPKIIRP
ncbi:MAG: Sua5/YciO/YrdC/YwlC family protein, partial [Candidatus Paceibacterota bacterium]